MRNTFLVCYDICDDKRLRKVFRTMRDFGDHLQYSVFECQFSPIDLARYRVNYRRLLEIQTRLLARLLTGEVDQYPVFTTR